MGSRRSMYSAIAGPMLLFGLLSSPGCDALGSKRSTHTDVPSDRLAEIVGTYHLPGMTDAENLLIRPDGTYEIDRMGCDNNWGSRGRVWETADGWILVPDSVPGNSVDAMELHVGEDGTIFTNFADSAREFAVWAPGRVCSVCVGNGDEYSVGITPCNCAGGTMYAGSSPIDGVPLCGSALEPPCLLERVDSIEQIPDYEDALAALRDEPCVYPCVESPGSYAVIGECEDGHVLFVETGRARGSPGENFGVADRYQWETRYYDAQSGKFLALEIGYDEWSRDGACAAMYWPTEFECLDRAVSEVLFFLQDRSEE